MIRHAAAWIGTVSIALLVSGCPKPETIRYELGTINRSNDAACPGLIFADPELELSLDGRYLFCSLRIVLSEASGGHDKWRVSGFMITGEDGVAHFFDRAFARHTFKDYTTDESLRLTPKSDKSISLQRGENVIRLSAKLTEGSYFSKLVLPIRLICSQTNDISLEFQVPEQTKRKYQHKFRNRPPVREQRQP
jgi:hypothetical protein